MRRDITLATFILSGGKTSPSLLLHHHNALLLNFVAVLEDSRIHSRGHEILMPAPSTEFH